jgi:hypothetical protein
MEEGEKNVRIAQLTSESDEDFRPALLESRDHTAPYGYIGQ